MVAFCGWRLVSRPHPLPYTLALCFFPHQIFRRGVSTTNPPEPSTPYSYGFHNGNERPPLTKLLDDKISIGVWRHDPVQRRAANKLERLQQILDGYSNEPVVKYIQWQEKQEEKGREANPIQNAVTAPRIPRGIYLQGPVGIGKSMLMDAFFETVNVRNKRRVHFHAFMTDIHRRIHQLKQKQLQHYGRSFKVDIRMDRNPIHNVALQLACGGGKKDEDKEEGLSLLCLDEFQVTDIADAVILSQLFSTLWKMGTVVVATSNRLPSALYEGGLNRSYFLPFIDLLERHCLVHAMKSYVDYRIVLLDDSTKSNYFFDSENKDAFHKLVSKLRQDRVERSVSLEVGHQRYLKVEHGDEESGVAVLSFSELCETELGASDYRALARYFGVLAIHDIPILTLDPGRLDRARRFVTLMDELYESKSTALLCLSSGTARDPHDLFQGMKSASASEDMESVDGSMNAIDQAVSREGHVAGASASVRELSFAFDRASSRIFEMTSRRWWNQVLPQYQEEGAQGFATETSNADQRLT